MNAGCGAQARDASVDGRFCFAVRTTGVFAALLVARSGALRVKNVRFFANRAAGADAGFRPASAVSRIMRAQQRRLDK